MSTISLPPIKQRIRLTRELICVAKDTLGNIDSLKQAGILTGHRNLSIDAGTEIRIEGFKSFVTGGNWPLAKISIYPAGLKMGQCYLELNDMDGLSWDPVKEPPKTPISPIRRVNVLIANEHNWSKTSPKKLELNNHVWGDVFGRGGYNGDTNGSVVLNPQSLSEKEIKDLSFKISHDFSIFDITVKIDKTHFAYTAFLYKRTYFDITLKPGLMEGQLSHRKYKVVIYEGGTYNKKKSVWSKEFSQSEFDLLNQESLKLMISTEIKKIHSIE